MQLVYSLTVALFLTIALMPLVMRLSPALGLIDRPDNGRKRHARPIPRCGGIAMALGIAAPLTYYFIRSFDTHGATLAALCLGALIIVLFGILDDRHDLHYRWKFAGQIAAALAALAGGFVMSRLPLFGLDAAPLWLSYPVSLLFILGVTNAVNLTDGLDGLAGGTSLLSLSAIAAIALMTGNQLSAFVAVTTIGGILGFLRFNTHPAQVFMGDTGSQLLGFIAVCLSLHVSQAEVAPVSAALPLLLLGLPILDTLTVMAIRLRAGRSPFSPDRNHLHHQIMALGFRHNEAVAIIYVLQFLLLSLAFLLRFAEDHVLLLIYAVFSAALLGTLQIARTSGWRFHAEQPAQHFADRRNIFLRRLEWFYRNAVFAVQAMAGLALVVALPGHSGAPSALAALVAALAVALLLALFRRYPQWCVRLMVYPASAWAVYLMSFDAGLRSISPLINLYFALFAAVLALAIRMTRREQFRLDTQDLLVLVLILVAPLLPIDSISSYAIGEITLRLAVLMYSCEFVIGRAQGRAALPLGAIAGFSLFYTLGTG